MRSYLAFDIGGTSIKYGIISSGGRILESSETPSDIGLGGRALLDKLMELTRSATSQHQLSGVGISTPGVVDIVRSRVISGVDHIRDWHLLDQCGAINREFNLPCAIENDAKSAALAEKWLGAGKPYACFYMVTYGTGLGGALVINEKIHRGHSFVAGEVCCLDSAHLDETRYAATSSLVKIAHERFGDAEIDGRRIFAAIREGNEAYSILLDEWCEFAALPLCDIYAAVDPEAIIIGGGISGAADIFLPRLKKCISKRLHAKLQNLEVNLIAAKLGNTAGMIGSVFPLIKRRKNSTQKK